MPLRSWGRLSNLGQCSSYIIQKSYELLLTEFLTEFFIWLRGLREFELGALETVSMFCMIRSSIHR